MRSAVVIVMIFLLFGCASYSIPKDDYSFIEKELDKNQKECANVMVTSADWGSERGRQYLSYLKEQFIRDIKRIPGINYVERTSDAENIFRIEVEATPLETFEPDPLAGLYMWLAIYQYSAEHVPSNQSGYLGYRFSIYNPYLETKSLVNATYTTSSWSGVFAPIVSLTSGQTTSFEEAAAKNKQKVMHDLYEGLKKEGVFVDCDNT